MRVCDDKIQLSRLIPKNHFCSMNMFREPPLINWTFTKAVLFTAYDIYRSSDFWLDEIVKSGQTLKEGFFELGFPEENTLVVDTGVFEMEAKKSGIAKELGIDIDIQLSNDQIFEAYQLSGADYYVAPDEIILPTDTNAEIVSKIDVIKNNLINLLDIVPASKVIAVIQGHSEDTIDSLFDFYRSLGITCFAMGGVIPLYHYDKKLLEKVLLHVRECTKKYWLHIFGLPHIGLLKYYLHKIGVDSVDTSAILYITARRRYLIGSRSEQVRLSNFQECRCEGCKNLSPKSYTQGQEFFVNLYIHNILQAVAMSNENTEFNDIEVTSSILKPTLSSTQRVIDSKKIIDSTVNDKEYSWMTAAETMAAREKDDD